MKLYFYGADRAVTGSCHCLEVDGKRILIDCGLQQGADEDNNALLPFDPAGIDCVLVTHAHIDHSGRLPLLVKNGYRGKIIATSATCRLLSIMLMDSAHIQEVDAELDTRKGKRSGGKEVEPLYTAKDAEATLTQLTPCEYGEMVELYPGLRCRFIDAGHLLGSASIEVWASEPGADAKKIVFSGDIGNKEQPIIRDPQYITQGDFVVMESTYGDREHEKAGEYTQQMAAIIDETLAKGGNVVIPSFAVGRTQELLYFIRDIKEKRLTPNAHDFPVYVDSPLAAEATQIYAGDLTGYADEETIQVLKSGFKPLEFSNLHICSNVEESKSLNGDGVPKVIISSSGMCEAGRIRHHLKHNLWRPECAVVFVGYQAAGTLGRILLDGVPTVKLFGEEIAVKARIHSFRSLSGHADHSGLLEWISAFEKKPQKVFVVHGEESVALTFTEELKAKGYQAYAPNYQCIYDLATDAVVEEGILPEVFRARSKGQKRVTTVYARLLAAQRRLDEVVRRSKDYTNKDVARFADQLISLCDKWDWSKEEQK